MDLTCRIGVILLTTAIVTPPTEGVGLTQPELDRLAGDLIITGKILENHYNNEFLNRFRISLHNNGTSPIPDSGWTLYFHRFYLLFPDIFPKNKTLVMEPEKVRVNMLHGDLYSLEPAPGFQQLGVQQSRDLDMTASFWSVSRTDFMPNWYLVSADRTVEPRIVASTSSPTLDYVEAITDQKQWKRYPDDLYNPFTAEDRFNRLFVQNTGKAEQLVIPTPKHISVEDSGPNVTVDSTWKIYSSSNGISSLLDTLSEETNIAVSETAIQSNVINLAIDISLGTERPAYSLEVDTARHQIILKGGTSEALFYAMQSLLSILYHFKSQNIPSIMINDEPRYEYRGVFLDMSRHFQSVEDVKRLIRTMGMYKLNKLHLHLGDDEGWRLEIPGLPELTQVGGQRCHDLEERTCIIPQYGSGPRNDTSGSGYLTIEQYKDILAFAKKNYIEVIPEFDMPGHAHAAIKSMEERYRRLMEAGNQAAAEEFLLSDLEDTSVYTSVQQWMDNAINPCQESTYRFIGHILDKLIEAHRDTHPLQTYHFGGDEVAHGAWEQSPKCDTFLKQQPQYDISKGLKKYFAHRVANLTAERGLALRGWEDGFIDGEGTLFPLDGMDNQKISSNAWDNVWEWGAGDRAYKFANAGYKVVMSQATHLYFDHPYEPDPEERGLYWAPRFTDTWKTFGFLPDSLYDNIATERSGKPITKTDICGDDMSKCATLQKPENIIGMQGHLWSENIHMSEHMDYMMYPRMLALAERAWHKASFEQPGLDSNMGQELLRADWQKFANSLGHRELRRLEEMGVGYRVPPPGGRYSGNSVEMSTTFPGLPMQYKSVHDNTWMDVKKARFSWSEGRIHLRTLSTNRTRSSRVIELKRDPFTQGMLDTVATSLVINAKVLDNLLKNTISHQIRITMKNTGTRAIPAFGWTLYFHSFFLLFPNVFPKTKSIELTMEKIKVSMIQGDLYSLEPIMDFAELSPGESRYFDIDVAVWSISRTDFMPNWYIATSDTHDKSVEPKVVSSTSSLSVDFVEEFKDPRQWKRFNFDKFNPFSAQDRYRRLSVMDTGKVEKMVIPTPKKIKVLGQNTLSINSSWKIFASSTEVSVIAAYLSDETGIQTTTAEPEKYSISLVIDPTLEGSSGSYSLRINSQQTNISLKGKDVDGLFYAVISLLSILDGYNMQNIPDISINDEPRYEYRGFYLDMSRHFHSVEDVKRLIRTMAMYKLNKLHLHLADDEGWRLEIPGLPELTKVGGQRCHDLEERACIIPQYGSGPRNDTSGSGYLTIEQYKDILAFALKHYIEVIPEFDMPGHAHAAIKSMEERHRRLMDAGNQAAAEEFLLSEIGDTSIYISVQQWMDNAINPCMESTYRFIGHILDKMTEIHGDIQPLKTYHFGGDEVATGAWEKSPKCIAFLEQNPAYNVSKGLKKYFAHRVANLTADRGLALRGWEDGFIDGEGTLFPLDGMGNQEISSNAWDNVWEWGAGDRAYKFANAGYKVVMSQATHLYFDHPYEPDPEERGLYWATRFTDTWKTFGFLPDSLYDNIKMERSGKPITKADFCADMSKCTILQKPENIIGMQGHLWSENIHVSEHMDYMIYPRMLALAERAWHKAAFEEAGLDSNTRQKRLMEDWQEFANSLGHKELKRLDKMGVGYRVPPPGGRFDGDVLHMSTTFPGLPLQYKSVSDTSWTNVTESPFTWLDDKVQLRTLSSDSKRHSRTIEASRDEGMPWTDQVDIDYMSSHLGVQVTVLDNLNKVDNYVPIQLQLNNNGDVHIGPGTWRINFDSLYGVKLEELTCGLRVGHVEGALYYLTPSSRSFAGIPPRGTLQCTYYNHYWMASRTDFFPNWYISALGMKGTVIESTASEDLSYVGVFTTEKQWKRTSDDKLLPYTPNQRYDMNDVETVTVATEAVIPTPSSVVKHSGQRVKVSPDQGWKVVESEDFTFEAQYLAEKLEVSLVNQQPSHKFISFHKTSMNATDEEMYRLVVDPQTNTISITASHPRGALNAAQTLISLSQRGALSVPHVTIHDIPRFSYRGVMLDVARNFKPKEWVFKFLDTMSTYKLNHLHLHMSDNEGWRVEIPGIAELTQVGGQRCQSDYTDTCTIPQLGSGPDSDTLGSGFYTIDDYREILQYAADRHITVIPEVETPAHATAAVVSMAARDELVKKAMMHHDVSVPEPYRLTDVEYAEGEETTSKWRHTALSPCLNSTYMFLEKVLDGFIELHKTVQPLKIVHIGGDELVDGVWNGSLACQSAIAAGESTTDLQRMFVKRFAEIIASRDVNLATWEDGIYTDNKPNPISDFGSSPREVYTYTWNSRWEPDSLAKRVSEFADAGYKVVLPLATHLYMDQPYEPDPEERGVYWASRSTDTKKVYSFMPDDIFANADINRFGDPVNLTVVCGNVTCPKPTKPENIIGMQAVFFSETLKTADQFEYMAFPRLLAMAERAWHRASWENITDVVERNEERNRQWHEFRSNLGQYELPRLEDSNIHYRIPPPGARMDGSYLEVNTLYPNHVVEFSLDGGRTWSNVGGSRRFLPPGTHTIHVRAKSSTLQRVSRSVAITAVTISSGFTITPALALIFFVMSLHWLRKV